MTTLSTMLRAPHEAVSWLAPAAAVLLALATPAPADGQDAWPMFRSSPSHPGAVNTRGLERLGPMRWSVATEGPVSSSPTVVGDTVYFGSDDGGVYAVDAADGRVLWRHETGAPVRSAPAVDGERVYVTAGDRHLVAIGRFDGARRWQIVGNAVIPFPWGLEGWDYFTSSPTLVDGLVVVGFGDGTVRAVDPQTGVETWRHATGGRVRATPAVDDGQVFVGSADGVFYALDLRTGDPLWTFATSGVGLEAEDFGFDRRMIQGSAAVSGETVYFGSRDARLYALDRRTGEERWSYNDGTTSWIVITPAVAGGVVYSARSGSAVFRALDAMSGEPLFEHTFQGPVFGSPIVVGDIVYVTSKGGEVAAIDVSSGEIVWRLPLGASTASSPVVVDGVLYVGTDGGLVHALERADGPAPRKVVYWDEALREASVLGRADVDRAAVDYFVAEGFEEVDAPGLERFLEERMGDGAPSVVVAAMDALPPSVAPSDEPAGPLIRYLEAGGKVVWMGRPPFYYMMDPEDGNASVDRRRTTRFTGVDHADFNADDHAHRPTEAGRRWGMEGWWMGHRGVDPRTVSTVLATDDTGRAAAWVRSFGGPPGTGLVYLSRRPGQRNLEQLRRVAEYGVFRRP